MAKRNAMTDDDLKVLLTNYIDKALNEEGSEVSDLRQYNFNRYYGKHYGNERDGHSKFTTREVFEAVEWAMPSVLRVFTSSDKAVEFVANNERDEEQAEHETDVANHYIQVENDGFLLLHNWVKDLLMSPNGYVKADVEENEEVKHERFTGVTAEDLLGIEADENCEIVEADERQQTINGMSITLYDIKVRKVINRRAIKLYNLPPEEALVYHLWNQVTLEGCPFTCHRTRKTVSDLVKEGHDADRLYALGSTATHTASTDGDEKTNRLFYDDEDPSQSHDSAMDDASRQLWVHDISVLVDYDGDNIAERRRILMIGDEIFENEEDEHQPIVSCASIIIPHKHVAMSYIEAVQDLQELSTTLTRQLLDNTYAQTNKRHFFAEDAMLNDNSTLEAYLDARSTAIIVRGSPQAAVMPESMTPITGELLEVIKHVKEQPQLRTGVAPNLSLDPNVLKQATEGAFASALTQASQRLELLVRVIAEVGYKTLMRKVHYLLRTHINEPVDVKLKGQWNTFDTAAWGERTKMQVRVGLGNNSKEILLQMLLQVLEMQKEAIGQNLSDPNKIYHTLDRLIDAAGLGAAGSYFTDPSQLVPDPKTGQMVPWQPPQPAPDPNMILAQAQAAALGKEQERKSVEMQGKHQLEMKKLEDAMLKMTSEHNKAMAALELEREKLKESQQQFDDKYAIDSATGLATVRRTNEDTLLIAANRRKVEAETGKTAADTVKVQQETSDEHRSAQEILNAKNTDAAAESDEDEA